MRHALAAGWLAGIAMILVPLPVPLAAAAPLLAAGSAVAFRRWGSSVRARFRAVPGRFRFRLPKTGSSVERA
jgi:hypothetical protein